MQAIPEKGGPYNRITEEYYIRAKDTIDYDQETGLFIWRRITKNSNRSIGKKAGNKRDNRIRLGITINGIQKHIQGHKLALYITNGYIPCEVDHINGDSSDNRLINLRECTHKQNSANRKLNKNNKTGFKGVEIKGSKFVARIRMNGSMKHLGIFIKPEDAAKKYNEFALKLHGEFARLNEIKGENCE